MAFRPIENWLREHHAQRLFDVPLHNRIQSWYVVEKKIIMVEFYGKDNGWNAYISVSDSSDVNDNLTALNKYIEGN